MSSWHVCKYIATYLGIQWSKPKEMAAKAQTTQFSFLWDRCKLGKIKINLLLTVEVLFTVTRFNDHFIITESSLIIPEESPNSSMIVSTLNPVRTKDTCSFPFKRFLHRTFTSLHIMTALLSRKVKKPINYRWKLVVEIVHIINS